MQFEIYLTGFEHGSTERVMEALHTLQPTWSPSLVQLTVLKSVHGPLCVLDYADVVEAMRACALLGRVGGKLEVWTAPPDGKRVQVVLIPQPGKADVRILDSTTRECVAVSVVAVRSVYPWDEPTADAAGLYVPNLAPAPPRPQGPTFQWGDRFPPPRSGVAGGSVPEPEPHGQESWADYPKG